LVAALLTITKFVHARIQGLWFYRFEILFGAFLIASFLVVDKIFAAAALKKWWVPVGFGVVAGWLGGFLALGCSPLLAGESSRIVHSLKMPGGLSGLLLLPFVLMSWFVGGLAGLIWVVIEPGDTMQSRDNGSA
jgi:hypothetical protein